MENNAPHIHSFKDIFVPSTCKERGYTIHRCDCGYEHKDNFQPLSEHSFRLIEEISPNCINSGNQKVVCSVCGKEVNNTIPPLGHKFGEWNVTEYPTCTTEGTQTRYCGVCGASETLTIKPTGHSLSKPVKSQTKKGRYECYCENCGETFTKKSRKKAVIAIIVLILFIAAATLAGIKFLLPYFHYTMGKKLIAEGNYAAAYAHLYDCIDYKDSTKLLYDFQFTNQECDHYEFIYDEEGNKSTENTYSFKYTHEYNEKGYISKSISELDNGSEGIWTYKYVYDSNGNMISRTVYLNSKLNGKEIYNENGDIIEKYNSDGKLESTYQYQYNSKNDIIKETISNSSGETTNTIKYSYKYDDKGKLISVFVKQKGYNFRNEYDENGLFSGSIDYDNEGNEIGKTAFKYHFDESGYKITSTRYDEKGIATYKYTYTYSEPAGHRGID